MGQKIIQVDKEFMVVTLLLFTLVFSLSYSWTLEIEDVPNWPQVNIQWGQLSAVDIDQEGNVIVFHRGDHIWLPNTFSNNNTYLEIGKGPISTNPVCVLDSNTGKVIRSWGRNRYLSFCIINMRLT